MEPNYYLWLIPTLPLLGAVWNGLAGGNASKGRVSAVALGSVTLSFLLALRAIWMLGPLPILETHFAWIVAAGFRASFDFYLDPLSAVMALVVTGVGLLIHIYAVGYMTGEAGFYRFFAYMNLFVFFMLILVLGGNYLLLFAGWEGVGLCSYLLIGFYFRKPEAADASKKAFLVNRIGDFGFLIALLLMFQTFHSLDFREVLPASAQFNVESDGFGVLTWICLLLLVGAAGKSAQVPLYVWLPDAMAGPTPASAMFHAATMVPAGVYVIARSAVLFVHAPQAMLAVAIIGSLTAIYAATIAIAQTDIKGVLAYSTISQIGYMVMACGVAAFTAGMFHLMTYTFFMALLILGAGSVIHSLDGEQDLRKMAALRRHLPCTYFTMLTACLAIASIPPLSGFWSQNAILWEAFFSPYGGGAIWLAGVITAGLTSFYIFRLFFLTFHGPPRAQAHSEPAHHAPRESPPIMTWPLIILAMLSLAAGWIGIPELWRGADHFGQFLAPVFQLDLPEASPALEHAASSKILLTGISFIVSLAGIGLAWLFYVRRPELSSQVARRLGGLHRLVANKYYVDEIYGFLFVRPLIIGSSEVLWKGVDQIAIDEAAKLVVNKTRRLGNAARRIQSGNIRSYAVWVALGALLMMVFMVIVAS